MDPIDFDWIRILSQVGAASIGTFIGIYLGNLIFRITDRMKNKDK